MIVSETPSLACTSLTCLLEGQEHTGKTRYRKECHSCFNTEAKGWDASPSPAGARLEPRLVARGQLGALDLRGLPPAQVMTDSMGPIRKLRGL